VAAVTHLLAPESVAVIGASRQAGSIGAAVVHNLVANGYRGSLYPVNPAAAEIEGIPAFPSVLAIPGGVEMAVITVPAAIVSKVARECGAKGVKGLVVISAGFGEAGPEGLALQRELVGICREAGMRLIGPNCMGIINTAPEVSLDATFAPDRPVRGRIGFLSQSGGLGLAVMARAQALGSGLSSFVSVGNKADLSGNDFLQYWETDRETDVIMLYLESFGNPRKFARVARRVSRAKPILAVKGGRTQAGNRATSSHTGALLSASDITVDALFQQAGVIRTDTLAELFDAALLVGSQPVPTGNHVAILTNAGGPAIGFQTVTAQEYQDDSILLGMVATDEQHWQGPDGVVARRCAQVGKVGPQGLRRQHVVAGAHGTRQNDGAGEDLPYLFHQRKGTLQAGVTPGAGTDGDDAVDPLRGGLFGVA